MAGRAKRVLVVSDFHCGHNAGLRVDETDSRWRRFASEVKKLQPIDICVANGDLIDGKGEKTGGTELITSDRKQQSKMAVKILEFINAKTYRLTYGTPYHVGKEEDWEGVIADRIDGSIQGHDFFEVNGLCFDVKHRISGSSIPHGRFTALARQKVWNLFWSELGETPKSDIIIRSHVHYFQYCGGRNWMALITPALQGWGSKFGDRVCEGTIDWGFVYFDVWSKTRWTWGHVIAQLDRVEVQKI